VDPRIRDREQREFRICAALISNSSAPPCRRFIDRLAYCGRVGERRADRWTNNIGERQRRSIGQYDHRSAKQQRSFLELAELRRRAQRNREFRSAECERDCRQSHLG
jgi:hypothetical protein